MRIVCLLFIILHFQSLSAFSPSENSLLNYNTIYFEEAFEKNAVRYELLIFRDSLYKGQTAYLQKSAQIPAFTVGSLPWATEYFWRIRSYDSAGSITTGNMHRFTVRPIVYQNLEEIRLSVRLNDSLHNEGGYVIVDYTRSVYDRNGNPVWTIPTEDSLMDGRIQVRDLRVTHDHTFTFLTGKAPLEIDRNGKVLWMPPYPLMLNGDTVIYHHDFQKTKRGTYLVLGNKKSFRKMTGNFDPEKLKMADVKTVNGQLYQRTQITMLLEFDKNAKLIWFWDANEYVTDQDLNHKKTLTGLSNFATHANALGESSDGTKLYVGFRDLSRIVCIDKKSKKVIRTWGEQYPSGDGKVANNEFRKQHGSFITDHNSILLLNNNSEIKSGGVSTVLELKDNYRTGDTIVLWKFALDFDTLTKGRSVSGGNVAELPSGNLLVCAGTLNRIFEVNRQKKIVWDAFVESRRKGELWQPAPQYRANWVPLLGSDHALIKADVKRELNGCDITVYNTGNRIDTYQVQVLSEKGKLLSHTDVGLILPGEKKTIQVKVKKPIPVNSKIRLQSQNLNTINEIIINKK